MSAASPRPAARLLDSAEIHERLRQETERAVRYGRVLSVFVIRPLDGPALPSMAAVALGRVRKVDLVGLDAGDVVVLLPETSGEAAAIPARRILDALHKRALEARGGLATIPGDGLDAASLIASARAALDRADMGTFRRPAEGADPVVTLGDEPVIALDPAMRRVVALAQQLGASDIPVLITGETGAGKEVLANLVHASSSRRAMPMVNVNCAALAESLLEAELFGYEAGAFTGATAGKPGLFEQASGGTIFLDEIGEAPPRLQAELLRVLDSGTLRRLGARSERQVDVRILAATNRDVHSEVARGRFRRDLFYRLNAAALVVPPLRERRLDVPALARALLRKACERRGRRTPLLSAEATQQLVEHDWPGNVRELRNVAEYLSVLAAGDVIGRAHLPELLRGPSRATRRASVAPPPAPFRKLADEIAELEKTRMQQALAAANGVRVRAAALIGMPLRTFATKLKLYGLAQSAEEHAHSPEL